MSVQKPSYQINAKASLYTDEGHTYIPKEVREAAGLMEGDEIKFIYEDGIIYIIPSEKLVEERGE